MGNRSNGLDASYEVGTLGMKGAKEIDCVLTCHARRVVRAGCAVKFWFSNQHNTHKQASLTDVRRKSASISTIIPASTIRLTMLNLCDPERIQNAV